MKLLPAWWQFTIHTLALNVILCKVFTDYIAFLTCRPAMLSPESNNDVIIYPPIQQIFEQQQSIIMLVTSISNSLTYTQSMLAEKPFATTITESLTVWSTYSWEKLGTTMQTSLPSHPSSLGDRITNSTHIHWNLHKLYICQICMKYYGCEAEYMDCSSWSLNLLPEVVDYDVATAAFWLLAMGLSFLWSPAPSHHIRMAGRGWRSTACMEMKVQASMEFVPCKQIAILTVHLQWLQPLIFAELACVTRRGFCGVPQRQLASLSSAIYRNSIHV